MLFRLYKLIFVPHKTALKSVDAFTEQILCFLWSLANAYLLFNEPAGI